MHATAWLYYEEDLSQHEVAERLNVSRSTVSRLLGPARAQGIVRIEVRPPSPAGELELERLALRPGDVLAISWGSTVWEVPRLSASQTSAASASFLPSAGWTRSMLTLHDCVSEAGDAATFKLLLDGVVIVSACPQDTVGFQPVVPPTWQSRCSAHVLLVRRPKGVKWRRKGIK
jgi:DNA-binding transcriptional regulator LsrR (DeoR family)